MSRVFFKVQSNLPPSKRKIVHSVEERNGQWDLISRPDGFNWVVDSRMQQTAKELAGDVPDVLMPKMLVEHNKRLIEEHFMMAIGESLRLDVNVEVQVGDKWLPAPGPDDLKSGEYDSLLDGSQEVSGQGREKSDEQDEEDEEEVEEDEREDVIKCPHCGATSEDTTFQALVEVCESRTRTVYENRSVRAWVDVDFVDEDGTAHVERTIDEIHENDEDIEFEPYDDHIDESEYEIEDAKGVLVCTECGSEFTPPGGILC